MARSDAGLVADTGSPPRSGAVGELYAGEGLAAVTATRFCGAVAV